MPALKAHAKINWFLRVTGRRADGYHDIDTLFQRITLCDELNFKDAPSISITTEAPIALDENLVMKAALMMRKASGADRGARIGLVKKIPIAAGLGGGSSDAAATLEGLNDLWNLKLPTERLREMALELGSDVPFFLDGRPAVARGRGEQLATANIARPVTLLLLNPSVSVSAGWAYSEMKDYSGEDDEYARRFIEALEAGDFRALGELAVNDLEAPVVKMHPVVGEMKAALRKEGALFSAMSGSGPTVFGVFADRKAAEQAAKAINAPWSAVAETLVDTQ
jgi:4-diphosphocytidyl-2-C-methyl-D-erythritol kinase